MATSVTDTEYLLVHDAKTGKDYKIPTRNNCMLSADVGKITRPVKECGHMVEQGMRLLDHGLENTACMESAITYIDGQKGRILYRGHPIEDLFRDYVYEDVMHLLLFGALPSEEEKLRAREVMYSAAAPPDEVFKIIGSFPQEVDAYYMLLAGMSAFGASDPVMAGARRQHKPTFHGNLEAADKAVLQTIQYLATTTALVYCHKHGKTFTQPQEGRSLIENLTLMLGFHDPSGQSTMPQPDVGVVTCLNKLWIMYADMEISHSTAAVLHAGSSLTDPVSCAISGLVSGHGPLHGGAIDLIYQGLEQIGKPENVPGYIAMVKAKKARLYGYGHRMLKTRDPRADLIAQIMTNGLQEKIADNPLLQIALTVDQVARDDPYFVERNLNMNVDLYGSFPYIALGFERDMITAITIVSRCAGAMAHWRESLEQPIRLWRPKAIYTPTSPMGQP